MGGLLYLKSMSLNFFTFRKEDITCLKCGWKGKGAELSYGDFSEEHAICDMDCPACGEHVGFWQAPLTDELERWKKANPGAETGW
ncbi:hypothetical protein [Flavihumibacter profundi]|jgi:hypothetical protein|uniref:hypothetical protein n=1 Tax=Flavihumibacter profundi TaxID=2716883 RepID=UPI001CC4EF8A|nr:hypothetical protein [Flavihumibacter profundi]MBZ5857606.1 hypothetical protein [Flavihumibacter profundi]